MSRSILILGARSDIGRAIAKRYARAGMPIILAARNVATLSTDKADLELRYGVPVDLMEFNVLSETPDQFFASQPKRLQTVIMVAGGNLDQAGSDLDAAAHLVMRTNYTGPARFLDAAARHMAPYGGCIIGISSVAGERGRQANYIYGSAKAGLTAFLSGLRQLMNGKLQIITVKPGFVATSATAHMNLPQRLTARPEEVADAVFDAEQKRREIVYIRRIWWPITLVIRLIPERLFKRMSF